MTGWTDAMNTVSAQDKMKTLDQELRNVGEDAVEHRELIKADIKELFGDDAVALFGLSNVDLLNRYATFNYARAKAELDEWGKNRMEILRNLILARMN